MLDGLGVEMVNTLPSTPTIPFNLIDGEVQISPIPKISPKDDLEQLLKEIQSAAKKGTVDQQKIQSALDILEGNPIANRAYSGFPLLHYNGPDKVGVVTPIFDARGGKIGGNVNIHQIWYDNHIESDTALLDDSAVRDVPWTATYTIDVLNGGADDFSPFVMYFDDPSLSMPGMPPMPHVGMDATFYPMSDGHRYVIKVKHAPAKYYNLTYTWGWRIHPPRVQVTEKLAKAAPDETGVMRDLLWWETSTFGANPRQDEASKLYAIGKIGELAPAKRMWQALRDARSASAGQVVELISDALISFRDWSDRTRLPRGVQADPNSDITLVYLNNTLYANATSFNNWRGPGAIFKATVLNGDHFIHAYVNVDFGGSRGWENQFQQSGGPGGSHTFGRVHWWMNTALPLNSIIVPPASADGITLGRHNVETILNYDAPQRIKLYQFDPLHHDVAVYSLH
ncbi:hypothetical protein [Candidatus Manganitrophus noduliformans]|uniref:Uncharacterized protein n=1 Tax=Candidatus Manganitrophus noduliformans TaxID=2606439 RepID=A0A7X6IA24_9BACT|nr:hypothetical protein [Candidatus Manganitrophus noduliformans]NKE70271.1 hypothetical protein [Candidatus Manganitrophus noduliformans]